MTAAPPASGGPTPRWRVCCVTSELSPLAKTGGLGDAVAGLCRFLDRRGVDLRIVLPGYSRADLGGAEVRPVEPLQDLETELAGEAVRYSIDAVSLPAGPEVHLVRCPRFFDRDVLYDVRGDEHLRFGLLSIAALESCRRLGFAPDVFHLHDWHAGILPLLLRDERWHRAFQRSRTLLTIHNLSYQGSFGAEAVEQIGFDDAARRLIDGEALAAGRFSFLASGIRHADALSTVSVTHAHEIQTPAFGCGLDGLLRERSDRLVGIVNGADHADWDPRTDPKIPFPYSPEDLGGKEKNKRALLEELGLPWRGRVPVLGLVSRLVEQKGVDLLAEPLAEVLEQRDVRLVALGTGEPRYEEIFESLRRRFPHRVAFRRGFDDGLAHRIQAGSDVFLMPSRFEPCGLAQIYAMRYGTAPIVHRTGGLADTVELFDSATGRGTGFVFDHSDTNAVRWALGYALDSHADPVVWERLVRNAMAVDFSWDRQGERYLELYRRLAAPDREPLPASPSAGDSPAGAGYTDER